jgi:hypothetical protein
MLFQGSCTPQIRLHKRFEASIWQGKMETNNTLLENTHKSFKIIENKRTTFLLKTNRGYLMKSYKTLHLQASNMLSTTLIVYFAESFKFAIFLY